MNTPCTEARTAPTLSFRLTNYHAGRDLIITAIAGTWHWRIDEPNASQSRGYPSHAEAKAAAHHALGIPAIRQSISH